MGLQWVILTGVEGGVCEEAGRGDSSYNLASLGLGLILRTGGGGGGAGQGFSANSTGCL